MKAVPLGSQNTVEFPAFLPFSQHSRKISVQTGTSHGGIPLPDGKIAEVNLDFSVLERTGRIVRDRYHLGGVVQHGASTLPVAVFDQFPRHHTLEIHLATGFQNIIYDQMPAELRQRIYQWVEQHLHDEWKEGWDRNGEAEERSEFPIKWRKSLVSSSRRYV